MPIMPTVDSASHRSAPPGCKCADCSIDGEACPVCYTAWWSNRHPNVQFEADRPLISNERAILRDVLIALEDLSFDCFAGIGTRAPTLDTYNTTFQVLDRARKSLQISVARHFTAEPTAVETWPGYTHAVGDAGAAYIASKGGGRLPGGFFWHELWDAMNQAARSAVKAPAQQVDCGNPVMVNKEWYGPCTKPDGHDGECERLPQNGTAKP